MTIIKKTKEQLSSFAKKHPVCSALTAAALLHLSVFVFWPVEKAGAAELTMPARVVDIINLDVTYPQIQKTEELKIDENKVDLGKKEDEQKKVQKTSPMQGDTNFMPFYLADNQPHPLIDISSIMTYPSQARKLSIQGVVIAEIDITSKGIVKHARLVRKAGWGFDQEVLRKIYQVRFRPALKDKEPVAVTIRIPIEFKLN